MDVRRDYGTFDELIAGLYRELRRAARRKTLQAADAEDLLQAAILKGYQGFRNFQQGTNFRAWMYTILSTTAIDNARRKSSRVQEAELTAARVRNGPSDSSAEDAFFAEDTDPLIHEALRSLPAGQRDVLWAIAIDGCSYQQVADRYDIPMGTVMSRYHRARTKAAKYLSERR